MLQALSFILLAALALMVLAAGSMAYSYSEHFAKRIDGFLSPDIDPRTQLGYATNAIQEGGFLEWVLVKGRLNGLCQMLTQIS